MAFDRSRGLCIALSLGTLISFAAGAQSFYPRIHALRPDDVIFEQLSESIQNFYATQGSGNPPPELSIYSYTTPGETDFFSLAAALSLPYDSLATLNRLQDAAAIPKGRTILVPSIPGIFVSLEPENDLEYLVKSLRVEDTGPHYRVRILRDGRAEDFMFFPGSSFLASERSFFLVAGFRFPLPKGVISSGFGLRTDPFDSHKIQFHPGIDIAAPLGTPIFAARGGRVIAAERNAIYGNYVLVLHDNGWESLYGHMSKILARYGQIVRTGDTLGLVGSTGISTGPHLHFEIRKHGVAENPLDLLGPEN
ncbi:MAG: M23 family metallopeptidase [Treponema sp.]|nr:M23 family metallopeptidase [Treponema sp.]